MMSYQAFFKIKRTRHGSADIDAPVSYYNITTRTLLMSNNSSIGFVIAIATDSMLLIITHHHPMSAIINIMYISSSSNTGFVPRQRKSTRLLQSSLDFGSSGIHIDKVDIF